MMNKGFVRKWSWPNFRYYPGICLAGLRKITKITSQDSRFPSRDFNPGPAEYKSEALTTQPRRSAAVENKPNKSVKGIYKYLVSEIN
jgi:hypothetical protein